VMGDPDRRPKGVSARHKIMRLRRLSAAKPLVRFSIGGVGFPLLGVIPDKRHAPWEAPYCRDATSTKP